MQEELNSGYLACEAVKVTDVSIGHRYRRDPGDIGALASSIEQVGLLQPIGVTPDYRLIWGHRRLEAFRALGYETIPARVVSIDSIVLGEYAENEVRKDFTPSEKVAIGVAVEKIIGNRSGQRTDLGDHQPVQNFAQVNCGDKTRDIVANKAGFGNHTTYQQAKSVVEKGAPELVQAMDEKRVSISSAAEVATLPEEEQTTILSGDEAGILKAAKEIRARRHQEKMEALEVERQRQARQVRASPKAPVVYRQDAVAFLEGQPAYDLLLTDPPYSTDVDDIEAFAGSWLPLALSKLKPTGRAYIFIGPHMDDLMAYTAIHRPDQLLVWTYRNTIGPATLKGYKNNGQFIFYCRGPEAPDLNCPELNELFSVQDIPAPDGRRYNRYHKWQKPDAIGERFVRHATQEGDRVVDPFCGSGTFLLAAARYGRVALGCDNDSDGVDLAIDRGCTSGIHH